MLSYNNLLAAKVLIFYDTPKVFINYFIGSRRVFLFYAEKKRPNIREPQSRRRIFAPGKQKEGTCLPAQHDVSEWPIRRVKSAK